MMLLRRLLPLALPLVLGVTALGCSAEAELTEEPGESEDNLVATFDKKGAIDLTKPSRILLVGDSDKLGNLPLFAATGKARRYAQLYPNDQIVLFVTQDAKADDVANTGSTVVKEEPFGTVTLSDLRRLTGPKLVQALDRFKKIASLDFFGHSSPFGALLEAAGDGRVLDSSGMGVLADNFDRSRDPYVTLNGCNGGVESAATMSKALRLPVSGALTGSNFQELMSDGKFYIGDDGFFPANLTRATKNEKSFGPSTPGCWRGACVRMKPQDAPYRGVWANPETGFQYTLSHYKFFCDYDDTSKSCERGMARSLHGFMSERTIDATSSDEDFKVVLADWFCTRSTDPAWFDQCKAGLEAAVAEDKPFTPQRTAKDYALECDRKGCAVATEFRCTLVNGIPQKKTCVWVKKGCAADAKPDTCRVANTAPRTAVTEYRAYLAGQKLLRGR